MATLAGNPVDHVQQHAMIGHSSEHGVVVTDFDEYTFQAPRPGFFLGDSFGEGGSDNPVSICAQNNDPSSIPVGRISLPFLGSLDSFPTELLCHVLGYLDFCSLIQFRRVNQHAMRVVDSLPPFHWVSTFPQLLGAAEALECRSWTLETMMHCILDERCSVCGNYGDILYLVTPERWCYKCWLSNRALVVQRISNRLSPMTEKQQTFALQNIPHVRLSIGHYGINGDVSTTDRMLAFDQRALKRYIPDLSSWPGHVVKSGHALRYTTVIRAPFWDIDKECYEEGFLCRACATQGYSHRTDVSLLNSAEYPIWDLPWRRYTRNGMKEHLREHGAICKRPCEREGVRFVHQKPFSRYSYDEPGVLRSISGVLQRCRRKEISFSPGQVYIARWDSLNLFPVHNRRQRGGVERAL